MQTLKTPPSLAGNAAQQKGFVTPWGRPLRLLPKDQQEGAVMAARKARKEQKEQERIQAEKWKQYLQLQQEEQMSAPAGGQWEPAQEQAPQVSFEQWQQPANAPQAEELPENVPYAWGGKPQKTNPKGLGYCPCPEGDKRWKPQDYLPVSLLKDVDDKTQNFVVNVKISTGDPYEPERLEEVTVNPYFGPYALTYAGDYKVFTGKSNKTVHDSSKPHENRDAWAHMSTSEQETFIAIIAKRNYQTRARILETNDPLEIASPDGIIRRPEAWCKPANFIGSHLWSSTTMRVEKEYDPVALYDMAYSGSKLALYEGNPWLAEEPKPGLTPDPMADLGESEE